MWYSDLNQQQRGTTVRSGVRQEMKQMVCVLLKRSSLLAVTLISFHFRTCNQTFGGKIYLKYHCFNSHYNHYCALRTWTKQAWKHALFWLQPWNTNKSTQPWNRRERRCFLSHEFIASQEATDLLPAMMHAFNLTTTEAIHSQLLCGLCVRTSTAKLAVTIMRNIHHSRSKKPKVHRNLSSPSINVFSIIQSDSFKVILARMLFLFLKYP